MIFLNKIDFRSSVGEFEEVEDSFKQTPDDCRRQLEFPTASSSGLGTSLDTEESTAQTFPSSTASILKADAGTDVLSCTDDSDDDSNDPVNVIVGAIQDYLGESTGPSERSISSMSIMAPVIPASTSMLQITAPPAGKLNMFLSKQILTIAS